MGTFKKYVRNCARPKASMALGHLLDGTLSFMTKYMQQFKHVRCHVWDVDKELRINGEVLEGVGEKFQLS